MCAAANLTTFTYWPAVEPHIPENSIQSYPTSNFITDSSRSKFLRQSMFFFNNITKPEFFPPREPDSKQVLTPLNSVQLPNDNLKKENDRSKSEKARPYFCDECGKSFLLKHHLTTHARTHTGIRPHVCSHCGKSFTHKHCLNTHLLLHSSDRPYQCLECKKSFTLKHHLITHSKVRF